MIEKKIMAMYKSGKCIPLGADGGVLSYIGCCIDGQVVQASITNDSDIQKIKGVWALKIDGVEVYNLIKEYYKLRI